MLGHSLTVVAGLSLLAACAGPRVPSPAPPAATLASPPVGAILLARESDPTRHDPRNIAVCEEYLEQVAKEGQVDAPQSRASAIIRTFWLDKGPTSPTSANCQESLDNYDFERAESEIRKIRPAVSGNGPFLVAYVRDSAAPKLIVDGAAADTDEKLRAAVSDYLVSASDLATYRAASAAVGAAPPRQRRRLCDRLAGDTNFISTSNASVGAYFAAWAAIFVAEVAICAIGV